MRLIARARRGCVALLVCAASSAALAASDATTAPGAVPVPPLLPAARDAGIVGAIAGYPPARRRALEAFYARSKHGKRWLEADAPSGAARLALQHLQRAEREGLSAANYRIANGLVPAAFDVALSDAVLRYLHDLQQGRVAPRDVHPQINLPARPIDDPARLDEALSRGELDALFAAARPPHPMYERLVQARERYARLALDALPLRLPAGSKTGSKAGSKVEPGDEWPGLAALHARLVALGDLPAGEPVPVRYEGALVAGVQRFQARHGLAADGVLGMDTRSALEVPIAQRLRQIELAMERLRWLPRFEAQRLIAINIPDFTLGAWELDIAQGRLALASRVVVGKVGKSATPVFIGEMRSIEFSPYWNVPPSILRDELLPKLRRDPGYLAREEMELVPTGGGASSTVATPALLDAAARGEYRVRQRPGTKNALGRVKFVLPNTMDIYLHDTPSRQLFERARRDFSHGCIRVQRPAELATWLLADDPAWTPQRMASAMAAPAPVYVRLARPLPVLLFYTTAVIGDDGTLRLLSDIYGHDRTLDAALRATRRR